MQLAFLTPDQIKNIVARGGGFRIDASKRTPQDLMEIASRAGGSGARITLFSIQFLTPEDMMNIASRGKGAIVFED